MGDAYKYFSIMNEGQPHEYHRLYNDGKVIESSRIIYLDNLPNPLYIENIIEIRIGKTSLRFITEEGAYYIISKDKIIYSEIIPKEEWGIIL